MSSFCYVLPHGHGPPSGYQSSNTLRSGMPSARQLLHATKASIGFKGLLGGTKIAAPQVKKKLQLFSCSCKYPPFLAPQRPSLLEDRIREQLTVTKPPPSSYDTAWVAMVPEPGHPYAPRFPRCMEWIMQNQHHDGSWWLGPKRVKDALLSTLACVLALRKWGVGDEHVGKGSVSSNTTGPASRTTSVTCRWGSTSSSPGMLELGVSMGLELPLSQANVNAMLRLRDMELKKCVDNPASGSKAFMAYVAEGLGESQDWAQVMAYQRKNGSFFNSPSTTAAAAIHTYDHRALDYLDSLISKFGSSVPTVYPLNIYSQLFMVDTLEKMGISHSFACEINYILDMAYRSWLQNDEEIMLDMATCAMAFRLLRMHGYGISSDGLARFTEESSFHDSIQGHLNDSKTLLELYKASQVQVLEDEFILESIGSWSGELLKQQLCSNKISRSVNPAEVEHALKFPFYTMLDRLEHKRNIESFRTVEIFHTLKSAYCACHVNEEIASLAAHEFSSTQSVYQEELRHIECWVKESRLDELKFARMMPAHTLFTAAANMFPSQLSDARIAWTKKCLVVTTANLVALIDKWDAHDEIGFCSEQVEIMFRAIYNVSNELGAKAAVVQNRSVVQHVAELWLDGMRACMVEAEWRWDSYVPSMEEYMRVAEVTFLLGPIVLPSLYVVGPDLPEEVIRCPEYVELFRHMSICGRLLNDLQTYEKERSQGKLNSVTLHALHQGTTIEAAKEQMRRTIEASRKELLRLVVTEPSAVLRPFKELFWNMCKVVELFWNNMEKDGYFSPEEMMGSVNAVLHEPLQVRPLSSPDASTRRRV
ncbi:hypothetical protein ACP70R_001156 [Stipagrostis hirtigluma subsp. patula]